MKKLQFFALSIILIFTLSCSDSSNKESSNKVQISPASIKTINTADYDQIKADNKGKVILINFFASWCDACKQEAPGFVNAYADLKDKGLQIIALSVDKTPAEAAEFVNKYNINFPVYFADSSVRKKFNITYLPTNVIYNTDGSLIDVHVGYIGEKDIHTLIDKYYVK